MIIHNGNRIDLDQLTQVELMALLNQVKSEVGSIKKQLNRQLPREKRKKAEKALTHKTRDVKAIELELCRHYKMFYDIACSLLPEQIMNEILRRINNGKTKES